jgi:3-oxoacyl-[acyl-carrier protein] reductase
MNLTFRDQVVLVTGGTRGIGKALAIGFANEGANVIITGKAIERPEWIEVYENIVYEKLDFLDEHYDKQIKSVINKYSRLDVCINNAGTNAINPIDQVKLEDVEQILQVNLHAPLRIVTYVAQKMKEQNYGRIINIASIFGVITKEQRSVYTASKSGLIGTTKTMAIDLALYNILVNSLSPGFVKTDLTRQVLGEEGMKKMEKSVPLGRLAEVEDMVAPTLFLASQANSYLTGQNIVVDGGVSIV